MLSCRRLAALIVAFWLLAPPLALARDTSGMIVLETDFGLKDGAVAAMKGVALGVDRGLLLHDLSHEIPPFDIWAQGRRTRSATQGGAQAKGRITTAKGENMARLSTFSV
jgi:hypothetical protein